MMHARPSAWQSYSIPCNHAHDACVVA